MKKKYKSAAVLFLLISVFSCGHGKMTDRLIEAVNSNDLARVSMLIGSGADIQKMNAEGESAVTAAARNGNLLMLEFFRDSVPAEEQKSELAVVSFFLDLIDLSDDNGLSESLPGTDDSVKINELEGRISELEKRLPALFEKLDKKVNSALEKSAVEEFLLKEMETRSYQGGISSSSADNSRSEVPSGILYFSDLLGEE